MPRSKTGKRLRSEMNLGHKDGDKITKFRDLGGCFLCGNQKMKTLYRMPIEAMRHPKAHLDNRHGPVFFLCGPCRFPDGASDEDVRDQCRDKFMKIQAEGRL